MRRLLPTIIAAGIAVSAGAAGLQSSRLNYEASYNPHGEFSSLAQLQFAGTWQTWFLLNEPVINCTASWKNNDVLNVTASTGGSVKVEAGEAEVYNLLLMARMHKKDPVRTATFYSLVAFCDAGIVAQNGRDGFNVAGSPNWDRFLCREPRLAHLATTILAEKRTDDYCLALGGDWLSAAEAKQAAVEGLNFREVQVVKASINASDAIRRVEKLAWRQKSYAYKHQKAQALAEQIQYRFGQSDIAKSTQAHSLIGRMRMHADKPEPEHLREYDTVLEELRALLADDGKFDASWQQKDQALVAEQLQRVRSIDKELQRADAIVASYREQLAQRIASEPAGAAIEPDLESFYENGRCGFRKEDGTVVKPPAFDSCIHIRDLNLYGLESRIGSSDCVFLLDHDGTELLQKCSPWIRLSNININMPAAYAQHRLVAIDTPASLYSVGERRFVFENPFPYPSRASGTGNGGTIPDLWEKNGRMALRVSSHMPGCHNVNGPQHATGAHFFFLDTMKFEDKYCNGSSWGAMKELRR